MSDGPNQLRVVPQGHWKTVTFVAALRRHGMRASQTIDGAMTGMKFLAYVEQRLAPTLKRKDIVMIDNLPAHKAAGVREAIEARGATLRYLPKYSPDLNPIEMPFSKLKADLRKAAERTIPRLRRRIGRFARTLTAREASNHFNRPESAPAFSNSVIEHVGPQEKQEEFAREVVRLASRTGCRRRRPGSQLKRIQGCLSTGSTLNSFAHGYCGDRKRSFRHGGQST